MAAEYQLSISINVQDLESGLPSDTFPSKSCTPDFCTGIFVAGFVSLVLGLKGMKDQSRREMDRSYFFKIKKKSNMFTAEIYK